MAKTAVTLLVLAALAGAGVASASGAFNFVSIGDWGKPGPDQSSVAAAMAKSAATINAQFVLAAGDNFYESGVTGVSDPQWKNTWTDVYTAKSLTVPWYCNLGVSQCHAQLLSCAPTTPSPGSRCGGDPPGCPPVRSVATLRACAHL